MAAHYVDNHRFLEEMNRKGFARERVGRLSRVGA